MTPRSVVRFRSRRLSAPEGALTTAVGSAVGTPAAVAARNAQTVIPAKAGSQGVSTPPLFHALDSRLRACRFGHQWPPISYHLVASISWGAMWHSRPRLWSRQAPASRPLRTLPQRRVDSPYRGYSRVLRWFEACRPHSRLGIQGRVRPTGRLCHIRDPRWGRQPTDRQLATRACSPYTYGHTSWGVAPGWYDAAPLARRKSKMRREVHCRRSPVAPVFSVHESARSGRSLPHPFGSLCP